MNEREEGPTETVMLPESGEVIEERRQGFGRREGDRGRSGLGTAWAALWAIVGSVVVLYLFFVALDAVDPTQARTASIVVLVLAVLWVAHAWRRLFLGAQGGSRADRERRGF